jgi:uncharacterized membrane protein YdbT with pleckstrin-like domain
MEINETTSQSLHKKLPIDADEKILAIYKHHWFAYVSSWFISVILVISIIGLATLLTSDSSSPSYAYRGVILAGAGFFCLLILLGGLLPAYLRSQEQLVLTEEALLQILQPTLFSSKVDQLSLQHVTDVSVHQDFFGTMFGFGKITIETPGEQNNYHFFAIPSPHEAARAISAAHENFDAALQGGRLHSNLTNQMPQTPQIDPQQYAEFLKFQQMQNMQQGGSPQSSSSQPDKNDQSGPGQ